MPRKHGIIRGRVQGVGFRYFSQGEAKSRGVSGWVRNQADGTVEFEAQGEAEALEGFLKAMAAGPPVGFVEDMQLEDRPEQNDERGFSVRF